MKTRDFGISLSRPRLCENSIGIIKGVRQVLSEEDL